MRNTFYKFLPFVLGGVLGWMMFHPPVWLQSLGVLAYAVNFGLCALVLLSFVALLIVANLPAELRIEPVSADTVHPELRALVDRILALGFRVAGPPGRVNVAPSAILLGFVHKSEPVYATAYRTETTQPKTGFDFVSVLHDEKGGLTTNAEPGGAALPAGPGGLRQVVPGATPEQVFRQHLEGVAYLRQRGVHCRQVSADTLRQDFAAAIRRQRELFTASPLSSSLVTLWRSATRQVPFVGPLSQQKVASQQIARLLAS